MPEPTLKVSVVIATRQRPGLLRRCLHALAGQRMARGEFEIVVVDDGPCDDTACVVRDVASMLPPGCVRYLQAPRVHSRGPAAARNLGWQAARAPVIAFTDDDTVPEPDWLARGEEALRANHWVAAGGRVVVPRNSSAQASGVHAAPTDHEQMTRGLERAAFVTANAFVRRDALEAIGGFDERFERAWREDADLQYRLEAFGPVGRCEDAVVLHPVRPERWGVSLRQQKNVFFDALLYSKHPYLYRSRIRAVPPWDYYLIVAATVLMLPLAVAGAGAAVAVCATAAVTLVLRLAIQRLRHTSRAPSHVAEMVLTSAAIPFLSVWWRLRGAWYFRTLFV